MDIHVTYEIYVGFSTAGIALLGALWLWIGE